MTSTRYGNLMISVISHHPQLFIPSLWHFAGGLAFKGVCVSVRCVCVCVRVFVCVCVCVSSGGGWCQLTAVWGEMTVPWCCVLCSLGAILSVSDLRVRSAPPPPPTSANHVTAQPCRKHRNTVWSPSLTLSLCLTLPPSPPALLQCSSPTCLSVLGSSALCPPLPPSPLFSPVFSFLPPSLLLWLFLSLNLLTPSLFPSVTPSSSSSSSSSGSLVVQPVSKQLSLCAFLSVAISARLQSLLIFLQSGTPCDSLHERA